MAEGLQVWVITDGRAGNVAQAMGLAEAIARARPTTITQKPIALKPWAARIPPWLSWRLGARARGWPFTGLAEGRESLHRPWPDLVIGAGRRAAPIVAALRRLHGISAVQLLSPQMPARSFDAVIVPDHDDLTGGNVLRTTGALTRMTPATIADAAAPWAAVFGALPHPRIAVLVGGPSRSSGFGQADADRLVTALRALAADHGLMITPSRRTPPDLIDRMADLGPGAWAWRGEGDNPYPGLLGHADAVLVTEESVNMASEAATTGLPVHIFPVTNPAPKIARFHESLAAIGASRRFTGRIEQWSYEPLAEADRIAADLIRRGIVPSENDAGTA